MKDYDFKGVIQAISDAAPSHLALVSFLVLPVVMNYWLETILKAYPAITTGWKIGSLGLLVIVYLFCLVWLVRENSTRKRLERMRDQIIGRLVTKGWTQIGFDSARKSLTGDASDEEIIAVIERFPTSLRYVRMRKRDKAKSLVKDAEGKQVYKHGVGLVATTPDDSDDEDA